MIILNMFRAVPCSSSGGQIVLLQPLVSSLSVNGNLKQVYTVMHSQKNIKLCREINFVLSVV